MTINVLKNKYTKITLKNLDLVTEKNTIDKNEIYKIKITRVKICFGDFSLI